MESLAVEARLKSLGEAQATFRLAQQVPLSLFLKRRGPEKVLSSPESVWKSGDNTIINETVLSPQARPGAPVSEQPAWEGLSPSDRERTPTA